MKKIMVFVLLATLLFLVSCNTDRQQKNEIEKNQNEESDVLNETSDLFESKNDDNDEIEDDNVVEVEDSQNTEVEEEKDIEESKEENEVLDEKPSIIEKEEIVKKEVEAEAEVEVELNDGKDEEVKEETAKPINEIVLSDYFEIPDFTTRPYAIMIDNEGYKSYPQGGIDKAQFVYEIIAEWGETRLMPIFYGDNVGSVGPVRSIRHYFIQTALEHDPYLVHIGFSPLAQRILETESFADINGLYGKHGWIFFDITNDPGNWQDTYTKFESLDTHVDNLGFRDKSSNSISFEYDDVNLNGENATNINLRYSKWYDVDYVYDKEQETYIRYRKGEMHIERYTKKVLTAKNIIIKIVPDKPIAGDNAGRMDVMTVGQNDGYYITNGKVVPICWTKNSEYEKTNYYYKETNEPIKLNQGQTWIMIIGDKDNISIN